jgi:predicted GNAT family N-acyltransferase
MSEILINKVLFDDDSFELAQQIRTQVFVEEQGVDPILEMDVFDKTARHYLFFANGIAVGTARWRVTEIGVKLERFAVLKEYRGLGYGSKLVHGVLKDILSLGKNIYLNSQVNALSFYEKLGFVCEGSQFEEAGIYHYKMVFKG